MKKTLISFLAFFIFQSLLLANDERGINSPGDTNVSNEHITKNMELIKKQGKISEVDLEKAKKELAKLNEEMANMDIGAMPMPSLNLNKEGMLKTIESLRAQGKISQIDFEKAKKELLGLSDHQIKTMTETAIEIIKKDPEKALGLIDNMKVENNEVKKEVERISPKLK